MRIETQPEQYYEATNHPSKQQFACLYTKHKTQKRKVWQDGRLVLQGSLLSLHAAHPLAGSGDPLLDRTEVSRNQSIASGLELELEKHLVTVEGPWQSVDLPTVQKPGYSQGMQKLVQRKFQRPASRIPPPTRRPVKRLKRPLQPGELQRQYYGTQQGPAAHAGSMQDMQQQQTVPLQRQVAAMQVQSLPAAPMMQQQAPPAFHQSGPPMQQMQAQASPAQFVAPPQAHQYSQAQPSPAQPPQAPPQDKALWSSNNGFDPNSFYEEEEEESATNPFAAVASAPAAPVVPEQAPVQPAAPDAAQQTGTLSTSQLLNLFGGGEEEEVHKDVTEDDFQLPSSQGSSDDSSQENE